MLCAKRARERRQTSARLARFEPGVGAASFGAEARKRRGGPPEAHCAETSEEPPLEAHRGASELSATNEAAFTPDSNEPPRAVAITTLRLRGRAAPAARAARRYPTRHRCPRPPTSPAASAPTAP